jgi:prefoldin subunit 5
MIVPIAMLRGADEQSANVLANPAADPALPPVAESVLPEKRDASAVTKETNENDAGVADETSPRSLSKTNAEEMQVLRGQLDALRQKFGEDHPKIRELRARIAQLEDVRNAEAATDPLIPRATDGETTKAALAQLRLQQAELDYRRAAELHQQKLISAAEYEKAKALLALRRAEWRGDQTEVARIEVAQAEAEMARVSELRRQNLISQTENEQAKFALEAARLRLKQRELEAINAHRAEEKPARTASKIPVLADIPVLGRLFRTTEHEVAAAAEREAAVARAAEQGAIAHSETAPPRKSEMRVVALKYCDASVTSPLVEKAMSAQKQSVHVLCDTRTNSLVVVGESGAIDAAIRFIAGLDKPSSDPSGSEVKGSEQAFRNLQQALAAQQQVVEAARARLQEAEAELNRLKKEEGAPGERR